MTWRHAVAARAIPGLGPAGKSILTAIALRANKQGDAWPSTATLCRDTDYSPWTVRRAIRRLEQTGHLEVIHRPGTALFLHLTPVILLTDPGDPARGNRIEPKEKGAAIAAEANGAGAAVRSRGHTTTCRCHGDGLVVTPNGVFACHG